MANEQNGGTRPRHGVSAWLAVGLALGWLAVLATFVRSIGNLLTAWAATMVLAVVVTRRRSGASRPADAGDHSARPVSPETLGSGPSASVADPPIPAGLPDREQAAAPVEGGQPQEVGGEGDTPDAAGRHANVPETEDSSTTRIPESRAVLDAALPSPEASPLTAETSTLHDLRVLTAAEVATVLRVDINVVISAIGNGEFPGNRIGTHWRVDREALTRWLQGTYRNPVV